MEVLFAATVSPAGKSMDRILFLKMTILYPDVRHVVKWSGRM